MDDCFDPDLTALRVSVGEDKVCTPLWGVGRSQVSCIPIVCQCFIFGFDFPAIANFWAEPQIKEYGFVRAHGYAFHCSDFVIMGIVPNAHRAHGFVFCIQIYIIFRYFEVVDSVRRNPEAETGIARKCNAFSVSTTDINIVFRFVSAFITLNLNDFVGLALADGEIACLPHILPHSFCQRRSSRNYVVIQLGHQLVTNAQFLYA